MNNCPVKLSGHLKVWLARAVTEKGTHDSAGTHHEYRLCLAVQKMSQKETTRAITSSSDKLHQTEREEMNEELLNGSFQLLILQLKPGAGFFPPQILRISLSGGENPLRPPLTFGDFCVGHHSPASPSHVCQHKVPEAAKKGVTKGNWTFPWWWEAPAVARLAQVTHLRHLGLAPNPCGISPSPPPKPAHPRQLPPFPKRR